jgi:hypothetical protein
MKKIYSLLLLAASSVTFGQTFYSENMGTPSGTTAIASNVFQNAAPIVYSGTGDVRATSVSAGYAGASGGGNVFINAATEYFQIDGLNTSAYNTADIQLSFGYNAGGNVANIAILEYSTNGSTWTVINYTPAVTGWGLITIPGNTIPSSATLSLRFTQPAATQIRIDDVKLSNVSASCTLSLGSPVTACEANTSGTDTYSVSIPYTGAGNGTYTITPNAGIVGGDNPTTVAAGNIFITGVPEGTAFSATVTGVTCNFTATASSPECDPVNTLPFSDSFNYANGAGLGASPFWTAINSGDEVVAASGSLNYTGVTSSANSITFAGAGLDYFSPFTPTTSGTVYASFLVNITDVTTMTATTPETYFTGVSDAARNYKARVFVKKTDTQYQLGLDSASTTTNYDATLRNVGDVVLVVLGYDFGTNEIKAWFNPDVATFTAATPANLTNVPTTAITELGGFLLRQDANNLTPSITFDELRIATTTTQLFTLGVNENAIAGLQMYPNPTNKGYFFVETALNAEKNVVVYDLLGKQVVNTTTSGSEINVANLNSGLYIVKITENGATATRKLVIE